MATDDQATSMAITLVLDGAANFSGTIANNTVNSITLALHDGFHNWSVSANDSANNTGNSTTRIFRVDGTAPVVTLISPVNNTNFSTRSVTFNFTATDDSLSKTLKFTVYLDGVANFSGFIINNTFNVTTVTNIPDGLHSWFVNVSDPTNNTGMSETRFFRVNITVDTTPPVVTILSPINTTYTTSSVWVNVTLNENARNVTAQLDGATNYSLTNSSGNWNRLLTDLFNGPHNVRIFANDSAGNINSTEVVYFTVSAVDTTPPLLYIASPRNITYPTTSIQLNVSANEPIDAWQYSRNGAVNITFTPNITFTAVEGANNIVVTANDTSGNRNTATVYFGACTPQLSSLPFSDGFNDGDACGWIADSGNWSVINGTYHQNDSRLFENDFGGRVPSHIDGSNYSDFEATVEAQAVSSPTRERELAFIFRATPDLQNFYHLRILGGQAKGDDHFVLEKYVNGTVVLLQLTVVDYPSNGTWFVFKLSTNGSLIRAKVWVKGTPEPDVWNLTVTDSAYTQGLFAINTYHTQGRFDNVNITPLAPAGNLPPVANAGPDRVVNDSDNNGFETVTLNGSLSFDPDGTIVNFTWLEGGNISLSPMTNGDLNAPTLVGVGEVINASFSVGVHNVTLKVTDNNGSSGFDNVTITVNAVDIVPLIIAITSPQNITYSNTNISLNVSANEPISVWQYSLNGGPNVTFTPNTTFTAPEGANRITVTVNDTTGNRNTTTVYFTVDIFPPLVTILSPVNTTYSQATVPINVTLNDDSGNVTAQLDGTTNYTMINSFGRWHYLLTGLANGPHNLRIFANDSGGNMNSTEVVSFTVSVDTTPPAVAIHSPINNTYAQASVWVNVTLNDDSGNVSAELDFTTNYSLTNSSGNWNRLLTGLSNGGHKVRILANDSKGNTNDTEIAYFSVDTIPPIITIFSPTNTTYQTTYFDLNFTAKDVFSGVAWTGYRLDGGPVVTSGNATFYENRNGPHNITVYANDSLANQASSTVHFTVDAPVIVINLTAGDPSYAPGDRVNILANVVNLDNVSHSDLKVDFLVRDPNGVLVHSDIDRTQKLNSDATKRVSTRFSLAPNATIGNYKVEAKLSGPTNTYDIKRATFQVA